MGTFWSYFLEFFGLAGLMGGATQPSLVQSAPALVPDKRSDGERRGR
ncbi:MAG: hypothetical protein ACO1SX_05230 [Actinomycetota bacterium]